MPGYLDKHYDLNDSSLISVIDELPLWSAPFGIKLLETINYRRNINVLDIGFGLGFPLLEIAMRLGNTCKIFGIDPWDAAIERTLSKIHHYGITNVEIIRGVAENIPLQDATIDLIVSNNGTNNVQDLSETLSECYRVAKSGAQFVLTVNLPDTMIEFYTIFERVLETNGLNALIPEIKSHIQSKRLPLNALEIKLSDAGFKIVTSDESSFYFRYNDAESMFSHFLISMAFLDSWKAIVPENLRSKIFRDIEFHVNQIAEANSGFTLTIPFVTINCIRE